MAVLAFAAIGAGAGSAIGGTFLGASAAAWGWTIGGMVGQMVTAKSQQIEGPRASDIRPQAASYGAPIARVWGQARIAGTVIWASDPREISTEQSGGGKGGGGASQTTYAYETDMAVLVCEGPVAAITRIWRDGELVMDRRTSAGVTSIANSISPAIYLGAETQSPDPLIEADQGDLAPAYRGRVYVVFERVDVTNQPAGFPNWEFEVVAESTSALIATTDTYSLSPAPGTVHRAVHHSGAVGALSYLPSGETRWTTIHRDGSAQYIGPGWASSSSGNTLTRRAAGPWAIENSATYSYPAVVWYQAIAGEYEPRPNSVTCVTRFVQFAVAGDRRGVVIGLGGLGITIEWVEFGTARLVGNLDGLPLYTSPAPSRYVAYSTVAAGSPLDAWYLDGGDSIVLISTAGIYTCAPGAAPVQIATGYSGDLAGAFTNSFIFHPAADGRGGYAAVHAGAGNVYDIYRMSLSGVLSLVMWHANFGAANASVFDFAAGLAHRLATGVSVGVRVAEGIAGASQSVADVIGDICDLGDVSAVERDTSGAAGTCEGLALTSLCTARGAIEYILSAYAIDAYESGGQVKFRSRGGAPARTISADQCLIESGRSTLAITTADDGDMPRRCSVLYQSRDSDYQQSTQTARMQSESGGVEISVQVPLLLADQTAADMATAMLWDAWDSIRRVSLSLGPDCADLEPSDVITLSTAAADYRLRITAIEDAGIVRRVQAVTDGAGLGPRPASAATGSPPGQPVGGALWSSLDILDIPPLRDDDATDAGVYVAIGPPADGPWPGAQLYESHDGEATWDAGPARVSPGAVVGYLSTPLAAANTTTGISLPECEIEIASGELESVSDDQLLRGLNAAWIDGEIVLIGSATLISTRRYRIGRMLRGRMGTDATAHAAGARFVLLQSPSRTALVRRAGTSAEVGREIAARAVTLGRSIQSASSVRYIRTGASARCLPPVKIAAGRGASGDILLSWVRQARAAFAWTSGRDVPLDEVSESYEIDIYTEFGGVYKRTISTNTNSGIYTAAQRSADGIGNWFQLRVYQIGALGRGRGGIVEVQL